MLVCQQVYHISRNLWSMLETRTIKNVCAPAAVIEDKIYIIGGEWRSKDCRLIRINSEKHPLDLQATDKHAACLEGGKKEGSLRGRSQQLAGGVANNLAELLGCTDPHIGCCGGNVCVSC